MNRLLSFLIFFVFLTGCDSNKTNSPPTISGTWVGTVNSSGSDFSVSLTIDELQTVVTGGGTVSSPTEQQTFVIEQGSYLHPLLSISNRFEVAPFIGSLSVNVNDDRDEMRGTMAGPGFGGVAELTLSRQ